MSQREEPPEGARGAREVERPTVDLGSGRDLAVCGIEPYVGLCTDITEPAWDSLSLFPLLLSLSHAHAFSVSLSLKIYK